MRVVVDTNVLISALLSANSTSAQLLALWRQGYFQLLTSEEQLDEVRRVTRYPKIRERLAPALAGRLVNELRGVAVVLDALPEVTASRDPWDNYLLATAQAGHADLLVSGDKADLISLRKFGATRIVTVRQFLDQTSRFPE